jgi:hypothetical protein
MNRANLRTYIEDHLAGSVAALQMLDDLVSDEPEGVWAVELARLKDEIAADKDVLRNALHRLDGSESTIKEAGAWVAQKMMRGKLNKGQPLAVLEALEMLSLGMEGRLRLWRALRVVDLGLDLPTLEKRAADQLRQVEAMRMEAAQAAFG